MSKFKKYQLNIRRQNPQQGANTPQSDSANPVIPNRPLSTPPIIPGQISYEHPHASAVDPVTPTPEATAQQPVVEQTTTTQTLETDNSGGANNPTFSFMDEPKSKGGKWILIFSIVIGILLIGAGYTVFRYFQTLPSENPTNNVPQVADVEKRDQESPDDYLSSIISGSGTDYEGIVSGDSSGISNPTNSLAQGNSGVSSTPTRTPTPTVSVGPSITRTVTPTIAPAQGGAQVTTNDSAGITSTSAKYWTAKNYSNGDLPNKNHTVVSGDTLWELAEGHYGNGGNWKQIADANHVQYMPNGHPLITPGMVITFP